MSQRPELNSRLKYALDTASLALEDMSNHCCDHSHSRRSLCRGRPGYSRQFMSKPILGMLDGVDAEWMVDCDELILGDDGMKRYLLFAGLALLRKWRHV